jgi:carbon-monoxide dehydrogenase large subunit
MLEADEHDIEFRNGKFAVTGTDKAVDLAQVARDAFVPAKIPKGLEPGLYETGTFDGGVRNYPNGCHISEVEIDEATGEVTLARYTAVDDVGHMINPMLVEGQLHGGVAMGVGQALMENMVYDSSGQVVSGSFMDYCMPRAKDFCDFKLGENEVPTKTNPLGVKGAGESGTVGALASLMNAINQAMAEIGAEYVQMPATPEKMWRAIAKARHRKM